jgi:hypothetical protein
MSGTTYPTTQRQIQENRKLQQHYSQKLKSRKRCSSLLCNLLQKRAADILQLLSNLCQRITKQSKCYHFWIIHILPSTFFVEAST